ncbi:biopolymer transporter ExbD [Anabaena sp. PCC 7108]|uniref:ExbD/TolR family protein n=1 Tax=Anabaena sp. PCC 7108 TaxID=163908 RepID=UPI000346FD1C|nr:biopolymer transporter ExbD [Anabaena sp. PCC 7108]
MKVNLNTPIEEVQIQIIPLIDVVFCILTFFLLAALQFTRQQAINVDLPKASTGTTSAASSQKSSNILPVTIDAVGQIYIEKDPIRREELEARLKQYVQTNPDGILVLNASRTATYNDVIQTLDLLRQVGGNRVSLGIIPGPSQSLTTPVMPFPNTVPIPGSDFPGNFNPSLPPAPNQLPATGEGISPGISPISPNNTVPQVPVAPENGNSTPKR